MARSFLCRHRSFASLCVCAFVCVALPAPPARAQSERILDFHSDIQVGEDGSMQVLETIRVHSAGQQIRHGIYRDFPTQYTGNGGYRYVVGLEVLAAARDGLPEGFRVEDRDNGKRIYLGRSNFLVPAGDHTYTISYATNRQIGFFADHDELFWNVTGNGWIFPIDHSSAAVRLPEGVPANRVHLGGYTGPHGSLAQNLTFDKQADGSYAFEATRRLGANEGLTILLGWPKGYVTAPTQAQKIQYFLNDNRDTAIALAGLALLSLYYVVVWSLVGRDPAPGAIVTLYEPPLGFSPAGMRYLVRMSFDNKAFASAVLDMAVKGYLKIDERGGVYTLTQTAKARQALSSEEQAAADQLFSQGSSICLQNENHTRISKAISTLTAWLKHAEYRIYFVTNGRYMAPAVLFSILMLLGIVLSQSTEKMVLAAFLTVWLSLWTLGVFSMISLAVHLWQSILAAGSSKNSVTQIQAIFISVFSIPFLAFEIGGIVFLARATSLTLVMALIACAVLHGLFHYLLKAPTRAGRAVLDKIEGFKRFLSAVDGDRLNRATPVEKTPELFEKFLPYAVALDVEHAWAEKFSNVLNGASASGQGLGVAYSPAWYSGSGWNGLGAGGFVDSLGGSFAGAISSSASAPGSGSGAGGGGGSGGGGGGGGGGGW
jgi:uncharacterized membrane protein YgcG